MVLGEHGDVAAALNRRASCSARTARSTTRHRRPARPPSALGPDDCTSCSPATSTSTKPLYDPGDSFHGRATGRRATPSSRRHRQRLRATGSAASCSTAGSPASTPTAPRRRRRLGLHPLGRRDPRRRDTGRAAIREFDVQPAASRGSERRHRVAPRRRARQPSSTRTTSPPRSGPTPPRSPATGTRDAADGRPDHQRAQNEREHRRRGMPAVRRLLRQQLRRPPEQRADAAPSARSARRTRRAQGGRRNVGADDPRRHLRHHPPVRSTRPAWSTSRSTSRGSRNRCGVLGPDDSDDVTVTPNLSPFAYYTDNVFE